VCVALIAQAECSNTKSNARGGEVGENARTGVRATVSASRSTPRRGCSPPRRELLVTVSNGLGGASGARMAVQTRDEKLHTNNGRNNNNNNHHIRTSKIWYMRYWRCTWCARCCDSLRLGASRSGSNRREIHYGHAIRAATWGSIPPFSGPCSCAGRRQGRGRCRSMEGFYCRSSQPQPGDGQSVAACR
jgi:hypothetical protein